MTQEQLLLELFQKIDQTHQAIITAIDKPWWEGWLQILTILIGIGIVVYQVNRQHRNDIEAQKEGIRTSLKLDLRKEIENLIDELNHKTSKLGNLPILIDIALRTEENNRNRGLPKQIINYSYKEDYLDKHFDLTNSIVELMQVIEKYQKIMPELFIFNKAMNVFLFDLHKASREYGQILLNILPFPVTQKDLLDQGMRVFEQPFPTTDIINILQHKGEQYTNIIHDVGSAMIDLRVCVENYTLDNLYPQNKLPDRIPLDPNCLVIKTDTESMKRLDFYFENETEWGKNKKEIEDDVRESILKRATR